MNPETGPAPPRSHLKPRLPELLAPAGDRDCLRAAIENGADAVYFGVRGHNARARAVNFDPDELPEIMETLHRRGVKGFLTLNTLAFPAELEGIERLIRKAAESGVDALIVQDLGVMRLSRAICPDLEIHASTQMSVTSADGVRLAQELGCSRVVLARELSLKEIAQVRREIDFPVEVFVHGALCVAYSGQCLTSEALGGRSANRGACAQACRMPYEIICDGEPVNLDRVKYLLSPQDLAAHDLIPELMELGVASLKIEGRLKTAEYVANVTRHYRQALDAAARDQPSTLSPEAARELELSFSRGFSDGFLRGNNHKVLVRGDYSKKRGIFLGEVERVNPRGGWVRLNLAAPVKPGDGLVFDEDERLGLPEQGGRVYQVRRPGASAASSEPLAAGPAELAFGHRDLDVSQIEPGQRVWKTDDPELTRKLRQTYQGPPRRKRGLHLSVQAIVGRPLSLSGRCGSASATVESPTPLEAARNLSAAATPEMIREQLERLGDTTFQLGELTSAIEGGPMVPKSLLNTLRRDLTAQLDRIAAAPPARTIAENPVLPVLRGHLHDRTSRRVGETSIESPALTVLCRRIEQIEPSLEAKPSAIYLELQDIRDYAKAVPIARRGSASVWIASPRIEKPGEANLFKFLDKQSADGLLVRNHGGMRHCAERGGAFIADFSMNAANELTAQFLLGRGATRVTASYDLNAEQLLSLLAAMPAGALEVVIHQRIPMFHMEHCVFCAFLSPGTDHTNCGRPCDRHDVKLKDRAGFEHPLKADVGCRNTLFNAVPQTAAEFLPRLIAQGASHLRVEFLDDEPDAVATTLRLYREAIERKRDVRSLWRELRAENHYGVTRGTLANRGHSTELVVLNP